MTDIALTAQEGYGSAVSWTPDGHFLARVAGDSIFIVDSRYAFALSAHIQIPGSSLREIAFCPKFETSNPSAKEEEEGESCLLAGVGLDGRLYLMRFEEPKHLTIVNAVMVEENLWALSWSAGMVEKFSNSLV